MRTRHRRTRWSRGAVTAILALATLTACSTAVETDSAPVPTTTVLTTDAATSTAPTTPSSAAPTTTATDPAALVGLLQAEVDAWMAETGAPGVTLAAILPDGREIAFAAGLADLRTERLAAEQDYWRVGSITKPMTSAVILMLADQGLVDLDSPVTEYLGEDWATGYERDGVDYGPLLTVRQLLNHTNGFAEYAFDPGFFVAAAGRLDTPFTPAEVVAWAVDRGPQFVPGEGYLYNTVGHVAAGMVIEAVTGRPAHEVMRELLFDPAGAEQIFLPPAEFPPAAVVGGYVAGPLRQAFSLLPGLAALAGPATVGEYLEVTAFPQEVLTSAPFTGGGIEAQPLEVARVLRAMFADDLLSPAALAEFTTPVPGQDYGLGISLGDIDGVPVYSHGGGVPGFRSHGLTIPELDLTLVISTNLIPVDPDIGTLADALVAVLRTHL